VAEISLGRLIRVEPREIWPSESADFTPWLARSENLAVLGDTVGLDLEVEAQEKDVGPFRADILCKDMRTANWVLIENNWSEQITVIWASFSYTLPVSRPSPLSG
jgi:hypothetical protein